MKRLVALLALGLAAPAHAQFIGPLGGVDSSPFGAPPDFSFSAPAAGDYATLTAATGQTISCSRASTTTYINNAGTRVTAASNRCVVESVLSAGPGAAGTPMLRSEAAATNNLLNSSTPLTQTTASLATGAYTGWVEGSGSLAFTAGSATATGLPCTATTGATHDCHFTVTVAGTVVATVTGSLTAEQLELGAGRTSYISTAGTPVTRVGDLISTPNAWNIVGNALSEAAVAQFETCDANINQYLISSDVNFVGRITYADSTHMGVRDANNAPSVLVTYTDAQKLAGATRYSLSRVGTTLQASAAGAFGSPVTVGAQPANPTTIYLGSLSGAFPGSNVWISQAYICANSATACGP